MGYVLAECLGDCVAVPQIIFSRLASAEDDWVRVALYVVETKDTEPASIARALKLKSADKAREALLFWKGAGLLENSASPAKTANLDDAPEINKPSHMTTPEVASAAQGDKAIPALLQECQMLMGGVMGQADTNIIVSMYVQDNMPAEMIMLGVAHCASLGKRSARYVERMLLGWQREGINTGAEAEKYLNLLNLREKREEKTAELFGLEHAKFNKKDRVQIAAWHEEYGFNEDMIAEAISYAGEKKSVSYVNGILRNWYTKGYKTVRDIMDASADTMQNVQVSNPKTTDVLSRSIRRAPVFKKSGRELK
ncbi:MAG: DnaD domain protein [Clostridia bacterium]|nr:DnaD domain protein [Clostridia bacterium]NLS84998.1 DnaD domain protein [Oscillospiraceae bacterium]